MTLDPKLLGERMRAIREARGLGQKRLAEASDTSQSYISQLERGEIDAPNVFVIRAIEELLGVYPNYLTEPAEVKAQRDAAVSRLVAEHGAGLGITPEEETYLRDRLSMLNPGPNPPFIYLVKVLELARAMRAAEKSTDKGGP